MTGPFLNTEMIGWPQIARNLDGVPVRRWYGVRAPIVAAATSQDTLLIFPAKAIIHGAAVEVETAEATGGTKTVDVGISGGDEDGFIDGLSVAATGMIQPTLADGAATVGAHLKVDESGGDMVPEGYVCTAATTVAYTLGSDDFAELDATIWIEATVFE